MTGMGDRLSGARKAVGLTQQRVADDLKVTRQAVSSWEKGRSPPNALELVKLITLYGVSADYVLFGLGSGMVRDELARIFRRETASSGPL